jgi:PadR family transcriptional regulator, regulatory protein PadR
MTRDRRPSPQTVAVLRALAARPGTWRYGYELGLEVGLKAGSLYPILMRLADRGLLDARWETAPPAGRPPRHLYRVTGDGVEYATRWSAATAPRSARPPADPRPARPPAGRPDRRRPQPGLGST